MSSIIRAIVLAVLIQLAASPAAAVCEDGTKWTGDPALTRDPSATAEPTGTVQEPTLHLPLQHVDPVPEGGCPAGAALVRDGFPSACIECDAGQVPILFPFVNCAECPPDSTVNVIFGVGEEPAGIECVTCPADYVYSATRDECVLCNIGEIWVDELAQCVSEHFDSTYVLCPSGENWLKSTPPIEGYVADGHLCAWVGCLSGRTYLQGTCTCCEESTKCDNAGEASGATTVTVTAGYEIVLTEVTGSVECSDDGGEFWSQVTEGQVLPAGKLLRTGFDGSARWDRRKVAAPSSALSQSGSLGPAGFLELSTGSVEIFQYGTCSVSADRCAASTIHGEALLREDFPAGSHVSLTATIGPDGSTVTYTNNPGSGGTIDAQAHTGPIHSLAPGESVVYGIGKVPVLGTLGRVAVGLGLVALTFGWQRRRR